jgi:predicted nucleic acid-binding protein
MVLVDTSVWIDLLNGTQTRQTDQFEKLIELNDDICINGMIYTEILQGIRDDYQYNKVKQILNNLVYLEISKEAHEYAAQMYRHCRKKGITIRNAVDCIIAASSIKSSAFLLHTDWDFDYICKQFPLQCIN